MSEQPNTPPTSLELAEAYIKRQIAEAEPDDTYYGSAYWEKELENLEEFSDSYTISDYAQLERDARFWEVDYGSLNEEQKRQRWQQVERLINSTAKNMYGSPLEKGISDTVVALNLMLGGGYTVMSCAGHTGFPKGAHSPWVSFSFPGVKNPGFNSRRDKRDLDKFNILQSLLDEFYAAHPVYDHEQDPRLGIYDGMEGAVSGTHRITTAAAKQRRDNNPFARPDEEFVKKEQTEMARFTDFLKKKYFGE